MLEKNEMIFGVRAVIEAIQAGREIDKVLVKKDIQSELSKELFACLKNTLIPVQRVPVERINRITRKNHQGVVAFISSVTYQKTEDLVPFLFEEGKTPLFVMLDGITDVRNFGAIAIRSVFSTGTAPSVHVCQRNVGGVSGVTRFSSECG